MSNMSTVISFEQFVQDFDSLFKHRVFRLETLDYYDAENEHEPYARFLAGQPADWAWREPWKRIVRQHRAAGRTMQRVHIVSEPLSDYIRFELLRVYPANVEAGEDVGILRVQPEDTWFTRGDFWLFDRDLAAELLYDDAGRIEAVRMINSGSADGRAALHVLRETRDEALWLALPLARYVKRFDITEGKHAA